LRQMLSKVPSKQPEEEKSHAVFFRTDRKMVHQHPQPEIVLTDETLGVQLCKRRSASVLKFLGEKGEASDETLKMLTQVMKSLKMIRKVSIKCQW